MNKTCASHKMHGVKHVVCITAPFWISQKTMASDYADDKKKRYVLPYKMMSTGFLKSFTHIIFSGGDLKTIVCFNFKSSLPECFKGSVTRYFKVNFNYAFWARLSIDPCRNPMIRLATPSIPTSPTWQMCGCGKFKCF